MSTEPAPQEVPVAPKVQLNPTVDPEQARPIPSLSSAPSAVIDAEVPPEEPPEGPAVHEQSARELRPEDRAEIPARNTPLDAELEAEINAALEGAGSLVTGEIASAPAEGSPVLAETETEFAPGTKCKGTVVSIHGDNVILDLGARASGFIAARSFEEGKLPEVGATIDVVIEQYIPAEGLVQVRQTKASVSRPAGNWDAVQQDQIVDCMVVKSNKGGLEVNVSNLRGFLPAGQVDVAYCPNLEQFVGQKLRVKVLEVNAQKRNLVVSRRAFLEIAAAETREQAWNQLSVGQRMTGRVKTIKDYGAFVDVGGVDGLLHVSEISWGRIGHPKDVLKEGQEIEVQILNIDREKSKISLGMKQLLSSPWQTIAEKYPPDSLAHGKVTKTTEFGAFVELEPGVEGMVHISELEHRRVHRVTDVLQVGQEIDVKVLSVDPTKKRIALSVKALMARPEAPARKTDEDLAPSAGATYERKRREPLKGGGTESGGLLFGNPGEM